MANLLRVSVGPLPSKSCSHNSRQLAVSSEHCSHVFQACPGPGACLWVFVKVAEARLG